MPITKHPLPEGIQEQLAALNAEVDAALKKRRDWMDAHMPECSAVKVGEDIWDIDRGVYLGVVTKLYRYWADRDPRYDTQMSIEAEYREYPNRGYYDNTSRQTSVNFGSREEARSRLEARAKAANLDWAEVYKP